MSRSGRIFFCLVAAIPFVSTAGPQPKKVETAPESAASPEMARLANAMAGDWTTSESMERGDLFPNGGSRQGLSHVQLGTGGTTLVSEGHSDGSAGSLDHLIVIWWDGNAKVYRFFTCFKTRRSACEVRGTAHWEGDAFVNDFEEVVKGKTTKFRDVFSQFTPTSRTLVMYVAAEDGTMKPAVTTKSVRR